MELANLIGTIGPLEVRGGATGQITALTYDAAAAVPGALHFCVPGFRADGHDFAGLAAERGASALVVERFLDIDLPQLRVRSSRAAMGPAADTFYGHPSHELDVIGVTGTNGKTTTCFLMYSVLEAAGLRPALLGTVESRIGGQVAEVKRTTPESIDLQAQFRQMVDAGDQSCAMEVSSHALALDRVAGTRFAAAAFTNLTQDHLDFHPTMEEYYLAKRRLMGGVARRLADRAIVTNDNPRSEDPVAIAAEIMNGIEMEVELDRRRAIELAVAAARPGDIVVIAGKGHEQGQQFADHTVPFDDRTAALEALEQLGQTA